MDFFENYPFTQKVKIIKMKKASYQIVHNI